MRNTLRCGSRVSSPFFLRTRKITDKEQAEGIIYYFCFYIAGDCFSFRIHGIEYH